MERHLLSLRLLKYLRIILPTVMSVFIYGSSFAGSSNGLVYHGRIINPDGTALNSGTATFTIEIQGDSDYKYNGTTAVAGSDSCVLYRETHTKNMTGSQGTFELFLGEGSAPVWGINAAASDKKLSNLFVNNTADQKNYIRAISCSNGAAAGNGDLFYFPYRTGEADWADRKVVATINTGSATFTLAPMSLRSTPWALQAAQIGGYGPAGLMKVSGAGTSNVLTPTGANFLFDFSGLGMLVGGGALNTNGVMITGLPAPTAGSDAVNKTYVDAQISAVSAGALAADTVNSSHIVDGAIVNADINAAAAIAWSKISKTGAVASDVGAVSNAGNAPSIQTGLDAAKPAFGTAGRLYVASDTKKVYFDSGAAWVVVGTTDGADITGNISGNAATATTAGNVTGVVAIANGGTGATTAADARTNLGLGGAAVLSVGTAAGTVAAGDDTRLVNAIQNAGVGAGNVITSLQSGNTAGKPAAGTDGKLYLDIEAKVIYRDNGTTWDVLASASGAGGDITEVAAGTGLTGGGTTGSVTLGLADIASQRILANTTGGAAAPVATTVSDVLDMITGGSTQGSVLYRGGAGWSVLAPGTSGQYLQTQGAAANPQWASVSVSDFSGNLAGDVTGTQGTTKVEKIQGTAVSGVGLANNNLLQNTSGGALLGNQVLVSNGTATGVISLVSPASGVLTSSGTVPSWQATLPVSMGGTGESTYTDGQLLIGNTAGTLTKANLTAGTGITITNGNGTIKIDATGGGGDALTSNPLSQFAATTSAQLAGVLSDETGSGAAVFASSPTLSGVPLAPTAAADTNTTQIATTAFVVGQAASVGPLMDGTQAVGTSLQYARADHVHASDTSRAPAAGSTDIVTLGTITTGVWNGTKIPVAYGGTGESTYTDGQLLIGNTAGTLTKANLTAGAGVTITNGNGSITIEATGSGGDITEVVAGTGLSGGGTSGSVTLNLGAIAANSILANTTGAAGVPEAKSVSDVLDMITGGSTQGSVLYRGGAGWSVLAPGTSGQYLQTQGAAANPQWASVSVSDFSGNLAGDVTGTQGTTKVEKIQGTAVSGVGLANNNLLQNTSGGALLGNQVLVSNGTATGVTSLVSPASGVLTSSGTVPSWQTTLPASMGGTGESTYTDGQLLIGNTAGTLTKANLTAGTGITITNGNGTIKIDATGGGGDALTSNPLSQFAATTSAQLAGVLSDETGSGAAVFAASPTLSGVPLAPTAAADTNTTQIATTAFVVGQAASVGPLMDGTQAVGTSLQYARADHVHASDTSRAPAAGSTDIVTLGTITTGVWNGTTIPIAYGGTGQTTATAAFNALAPSQTGNSGKFLTTDGTNTSWAAISDPTAFKNGGNSFTGDATLGTNDTYKLNFETDGTTQMTIDTSGNVGIGATSPWARLEVKSAAADSGIAAFDATTGTDIFGVWQESDNSGTIYLKNGSSTITAEIKSAGDSFFNGGNVGIGTNSPDQKLEVDGGIKVGIGEPTGANANASGLSFDGDTGVFSPSDGQLNFWSNNNRVMTVIDSGVGIGTTSPGEKLSVSGNISATGKIVGGVSTDADALSALTVDFTNINTIRATGAAAACGTLNITNTTSGGYYTLTILNASATCSTIQWNGATTNVKLPAGYAGGVSVSGVIYTVIDDGATLWVSYVPF